MKNAIRICIILVFLVSIGAGLVICSQDKPAVEKTQSFIEQYGPVVDEALNAYNNEDCKNFYKNFSKQRQGLTEEVFKAIWIDMYKRDFGNLISKKLIPEKCDLNTVCPLLVYRGKFEKNPDVIIKATFTKDDDSPDYKLFYIRFDADLGW